MRICREGWPFVLGSGGAGLFLLLMAHVSSSSFTGVLAVLALVLAVFSVYFFRDPVRKIPSGERFILSPADGRILEVKEGVIRIFLSLFDVHIQRSPITGRIRTVRHKAGKFLDARNPRAALENEQNRIEIFPAEMGAENVVVTQIAGLLARRIVCWVKEGQPVKRGEQIGLIRFGSQVDVTLPKAAKIRVRTGDRVRAGESIVAEK
jgi:phosphatidylserine decarboxylase